MFGPPGRGLRVPCLRDVRLPERRHGARRPAGRGAVRAVEPSRDGGDACRAGRARPAASADAEPRTASAPPRAPAGRGPRRGSGPGGRRVRHHPPTPGPTSSIAGRRCVSSRLRPPSAARRGNAARSASATPPRRGGAPVALHRRDRPVGSRRAAAPTLPWTPARSTSSSSRSSAPGSRPDVVRPRRASPRRSSRRPTR